MNNLSTHIERITKANTAEDAFDYFSTVLRNWGYDRTTYSLVTDHPSLGLNKMHGLATSYPEDWMKYYVEQNYMELDAVFLSTLNANTPFYWNDLKTLKDISKKSIDVIDQAADAGLNEGICIPLLGKSGEKVGIGLAKSDKDDDKKDYELLSSIYLMSVHFHETFRSHFTLTTKPDLTLREQDVLLWAAEGKTDDEIATLLTISTNTVRFHWKNIFKKLDAYNRIYAVTKAIRLELIVPRSIYTYQNR
jgi:DNA-binding CsgD family transcriptional regulator